MGNIRGIKLEIEWGTKTQYIIISENNLNQDPDGKNSKENLNLLKS